MVRIYIMVKRMVSLNPHITFWLAWETYIILKAEKGHMETHINRGMANFALGRNFNQI